jgi:hypothetical protein
MREKAATLSKTQFHSVGGPGRHAATEEVVVFRPYRTVERERGSQNRPIVFISPADSLAGHGLKP